MRIFFILLFAISFMLFANGPPVADIDDTTFFEIEADTAAGISADSSDVNEAVARHVEEVQAPSQDIVSTHLWAPPAETIDRTTHPADTNARSLKDEWSNGPAVC